MEYDMEYMEINYPIIAEIEFGQLWNLIWTLQCKFLQSINQLTVNSMNTIRSYVWIVYVCTVHTARHKYSVQSWQLKIEKKRKSSIRLQPRAQANRWNLGLIENYVITFWQSHDSMIIITVFPSMHWMHYKILRWCRFYIRARFR